MSRFLAEAKKGRGYGRLFTAGIINGIGDRFSSVAMLALVLQLTGSGMAVGLALGVRVIPYLLLAPLGGLAASYVSRKKLMIAADLARIPFALCLIWVDSAEKLPLLYTASLALAAGEAVYLPLRKSSIPLLVRPEGLLRVNALEQLMTGVVLIVGALAGGAVSHWLGQEWAFGINALSFLAGAALVAGIDFGKREPVQTQQNVPSKPEVKSGPSGLPAASPRRGKLSFWLGASAVLQVILLAELLIPLFNGIDNVLISVYAVQEFGMGDIGIGALYAALGIGLVLSFGAGKLLPKRLLPAAIALLMLEGLFLMAVSGSFHFAGTFMLFVLISLTGGLGNACFDTLLMREVPANRQAAFFGMLAAYGNAAMGLSMMAAGALLDYVPARTLGFAGGAAYTGIALLLGAYAAFYSIRRRRGITPVE